MSWAGSHGMGMGGPGEDAMGGDDDDEEEFVPTVFRWEHGGRQVREDSNTGKKLHSPCWS
jgi:hypothetical protein